MRATKQPVVHALFALLLSGVCTGAAAGGIFVPSDDLANDMLNSMLAQQVLEGAAQTGQAKKNALRAAERKASRGTSFVPDAKITSATVRQLASHYPADKRGEAARTFAQLLDGYLRIEQQFGIPRYDTAGAVAAFIAGNYMAYHNVDFPDGHFKVLVDQMRSVVATTPEFARADDRTRQEMHEQMAILGTMMATTQMALKRTPQPKVAADLRAAAKGYLEQFLKTDADRIHITERGLVIE